MTELKIIIINNNNKSSSLSTNNLEYKLKYQWYNLVGYVCAQVCVCLSMCVHGREGMGEAFGIAALKCGKS